MIFVVSDLHLGRKPANDWDILRDLRACITAVFGGVRERHTAPRREVIFLGDVFDAYIDYPGYEPPLLSAWLDLVDELRDAGVRVSYHAGNHDRWHAGTFRRLGFEPYRKPVVRTFGGRRILLGHGDTVDDHGRATRLVRAVTGSRWAYRAYTTVLPAQAGNALAAFVSRRYARADPTESTVAALRRFASTLLGSGAVDVAVFGHCHRAELLPVREGAYLNTGDWFAARSFGLIRSEGVSLNRWTKTGAEQIQSKRWAEPAGKNPSDDHNKSTRSVVHHD